MQPSQAAVSLSALRTCDSSILLLMFGPFTHWVVFHGLNVPQLVYSI